METSLNSPPRDGGDLMATFRKTSNDGSSRKYRRHRQSSSSDGSPERNQSTNSKHPRGEIRKVSEPGDEYKEDRRESDRRYGRGGRDSHRHDRYSRGDKTDEYNKYERDIPRFNRDSRGGHHSDHRRVETEPNRSRNDSNRHFRDKYRSSGHRNNGNEKGEDLSSGKRQHKEKDRVRGGESHHSRDERKKHEDVEISKEKDVHVSSPRDRSENQDTHSKRMKGFISEKFTHGNTNAEEKQSSSFKPASGGDVDAAKVAAMQAAELVNKNLVGTGYLTTDQKKKLLWGKKKNQATEEPSHRWDSALIGDRERQEKFNKLMGVKGSIVNQEQNLTEIEVEKQKELQMDLEKQYTAGLRRRDGRTVGLGL